MSLFGFGKAKKIQDLKVKDLKKEKINQMQQTPPLSINGEKRLARSVIPPEIH